MTNWAYNIPEAGTLCKDEHKVIRKIVGYNDEFDVVYDGDSHTYLVDSLTPITPQEWWQFAPWNYDMDSAPKNGDDILLKNCEGDIKKSYWFSRNKSWDTGFNEFIDPIAWLPLPENK